MKTISIILLCALVGLTIGANEWTLVPGQEVNDNTPMSFKIILQQQNLGYLDSLFWQVSDIKNPLYGKFLTNDQIADIIAPAEADIQTVEQYLTKESGKVCDVITARNVHRDYIFVNTCAGQAKVIFPNLNLAVYQKLDNADDTIVRSSILVDVLDSGYLLGVPQTVLDNISAIHDITDTPVPIKRVNSNADPTLPWQNSDKELTINDMIKEFNITYDDIKSASLETNNGQVRQGVVEFEHTYFSASELAAYQKKYDLPINPIRKIIGTQNPSGGEGGEVSLDVQTITGISGSVHTWDFVFGDKLDWLDVVETVMTTDDAPKVLSCSWGTWESDFNASKVAHVNAAFMKLGLAGFTMFIAAGDSGPSLSNNCETYDPEFPATCPYIVSVGGTKIDKNTGVEGAWMHSTGGFSGLNPRPSYQDEKVTHYLQNATLPPNKDGKIYNTTGRAYPDVSAFGAYQPVLAGYYQPIGGTSSATPQFAAITALINVLRFQKGLGPVGPLTKTLWQLEEGVGFDVVEGKSFATNRQGGCASNVFKPGFEALQGWDPVTGLGSPRLNTLVKQLVPQSE